MFSELEVFFLRLGFSRLIFNRELLSIWLFRGVVFFSGDVLLFFLGVVYSDSFLEGF